MIYVLFVMDRVTPDVYDDLDGSLYSYGETIYKTKFVTTDIALLKDQVEFLKEIKLDYYVEVWTINGLYKGRLDAILLN